MTVLSASQAKRNMSECKKPSHERHVISVCSILLMIVYFSLNKHEWYWTRGGDGEEPHPILLENGDIWLSYIGSVYHTADVCEGQALSAMR